MHTVPFDDRIIASHFPRLAITFLLATVLLSGCTARERIQLEFLTDPPCSGGSGISWAGPKEADDRKKLHNWCRSVGPVMVHPPDIHPVDVGVSGLTIITWNKHEDYGDLERLLRSLPYESPMVVLLQEMVRADKDVPRHIPAGVQVPARIGPAQKLYRDVETIARELNMSFVYLPSMPNGLRTGEDRGCAILSTLPISDITGIELPWIAQRRVAVMATVTALKNGEPWRLRIVNMHLDTRGGKSRQAAAVADFLARQKSPEVPTLVGGDLNTWYGVHDRAIQEIDRVVPLVRKCGSAPTFRFGLFLLRLRLDHLFTNLPPQTHVRCFVETDRFGSDHHPVILQLFKARHDSSVHTPDMR